MRRRKAAFAFHDLREYVTGDDLRLIHWKSSAKTGDLMVRHNVDTYQPRSLVVLDVHDKVYSDDAFEPRCGCRVADGGVDLQQLPVRLRTTGGLVIGSEGGGPARADPRPAGRSQAGARRQPGVDVPARFPPSGAATPWPWSPARPPPRPGGGGAAARALPEHHDRPSRGAGPRLGARAARCRPHQRRHQHRVRQAWGRRVRR